MIKKKSCAQFKGVFDGNITFRQCVNMINNILPLKYLAIYICPQLLISCCNNKYTMLLIVKKKIYESAWHLLTNKKNQHQKITKVYYMEAKLHSVRACFISFEKQPTLLWLKILNGIQKPLKGFVASNKASYMLDRLSTISTINSRKVTWLNQ